jgi:hypothetical protein
MSLLHRALAANQCFLELWICLGYNNYMWTRYVTICSKGQAKKVEKSGTAGESITYCRGGKLPSIVVTTDMLFSTHRQIS